MSDPSLPRPALEVAAAAGARVRLLGLNPGLLADGRWRGALRVEVVAADGPEHERPPAVSGDWEVADGEVGFEPHFPYAPGVRYRARFEPGAVGLLGLEALTAEFALPKPEPATPPEVTAVFPSADVLPENLLRLYIHFSRPMRRGGAQASTALLAGDGAPVPDALYRAPVELWDPAMRRLTVLLDPGRLKRGVGPNRLLGPPLQHGDDYALAIGPGMTDIDGRSLAGTAVKRFRASAAVRTALAVQDWLVEPPAARTFAPLTVDFPTSMDEVLLMAGLGVTSADGRRMDGRVSVDRGERRWRFAPAVAWGPGAYRLHVASAVEDVCGNGLAGAFDRPLRRGSDLAVETLQDAIAFEVR